MRDSTVGNQFGKQIKVEFILTVHNFKNNFMRQAIISLTIVCVILFSCNKDTTPTSIEGTWKMISVVDNTTNQTATKSPSIQGEVIITFSLTNSSSGTFFGNTPTNDIEKNNFSIGTNQTITINSLSMSKVDETTWGDLFVKNIRDSKNYAFGSGNLLTIKTINKTLTFHK